MATLKYLQSDLTSAASAGANAPASPFLAPENQVTLPDEPRNLPALPQNPRSYKPQGPQVPLVDYNFPLPKLNKPPVPAALTPQPSEQPGPVYSELERLGAKPGLLARGADWAIGGMEEGIPEVAEGWSKFGGWKTPTVDKRLEGLGEVVGGMAKAGRPLLAAVPEALATKPTLTAMEMAVGMLAPPVVEAGMRAVGAPEGATKLATEVAGVAPIGPAVMRGMAKPTASPKTEKYFQSDLVPEPKIPAAVGTPEIKPTTAAPEIADPIPLSPERKLAQRGSIPIQGNTKSNPTNSPPRTVEDAINDIRDQMGVKGLTETPGLVVRQMLEGNMEGIRKSRPDVAMKAAQAGPGVTVPLARQAIHRAYTGIKQKFDTLSLPAEAFNDSLIDNRLEGIQNWAEELGGAFANSSPEEFAKEMSKASTRGLIEKVDQNAGTKMMEFINAAREVDKSGRSSGIQQPGQYNQKAWAPVQEYIARNFQSLHGRVGEVRDKLDFKGKYNLSRQELEALPQYQESLAEYKANIEAPMQEAFLDNEGILSKRLGPNNTYFPLTPKPAVGESGDIGNVITKLFKFKTANNPQNYLSMGLSSEYDNSLKILGQKLEYSMRTNNRGALLKTLADEKIGQVVPEDWRPSKDVGEIEAIEYKKGSTKILPDGNTSYTPGTKIILPKEVARQLGGVLDPKRPSWAKNTYKSWTKDLPVEPGKTKPDSAGSEIADNPASRMIQIMLLTPSDNVQFFLNSLHSYGSLLNTNAWKMGKGGSFSPSQGLKYGTPLVSNMTKSLSSLVDLARINPSTPENQMLISKITKEGVLHPRHMRAMSKYDDAQLAGDVEWSPSPKQIGKELIRGVVPKKEIAKAAIAGQLGLDSALYGPNGWDVRLRLGAYKASQQMFPNAPDTFHAEFANQLPKYSREMASQLENFLKDAELGPIKVGQWTAPFASTSLGFLRLGLRTAFGMQKTPKEMPMGEKALQVLGNNLIGGLSSLVATWALMNYATRGQMPWKDPEGAPFPEVAVDPKYAELPALKPLISGSKKGSPTINVLRMFNPLTLKAADLTGQKNAMNSSIDTGSKYGSEFSDLARGFFWPAMIASPEGGKQGTRNQMMIQEGLRGTANRVLGTFSGPGPALMSGATGVQPYITSPYDITGKSTPQLMNKSTPSKTALEATIKGTARGVGSILPGAENAFSDIYEAATGSGLNTQNKKARDPHWAAELIDTLLPFAIPKMRDREFEKKRARNLEGLLERKAKRGR